MSARRAAAAGALALLACAVLASDPDGSLLPAHYETYGEILLHAQPLPGEDPSYRMPLASLAAAAASEAHAAFGTGAQQRAATAVTGFYAFVAASSLGGAPGALAAAFAAPSLAERSDWVQSLYAAALLLVAAALAVRARRPGPAADWALAAALGASLLLRSPLFLFPAVLLAVERSRGAAVLLGLPAALLAPWIVLNWAAHGRFILFESTAANDNVIAAALGFVRTYEGDAATLLPPGLSPRDSGGVLAWALREVLAHPVRYLTGLAGRVAYFVSLRPLLLVLAAAAAWRGRRDPATRALALLAGYFAAIHLLFAVDDLFFQPLWPLLAALAASLIPDFKRDWPWPRLTPRAAESIVRTGAALAAAAALAAGALCLRYAAVVRLGGALAARLERSDVSRDPFLAHARADIRRRAGDLAGAAADYAVAVRGGRERESAEVKRRWLEALARRAPDAAAIARVRFDRRNRAPDLSMTNAALLRAHAALRAGRRDDARRALRAAVAQFDDAAFVRGHQDARSAELASALRASRRFLLEAAADALAGMPRREREDYFDLLDEVLGRPPDFGERRDAALRNAAWIDARARAVDPPAPGGHN